MITRPCIKSGTVADGKGPIPTEWVHYGASRYDPSRFSTVMDTHFNKPRGGLWGSPNGAEYGWKEWCEANSFRTTALKKHFTFRVSGKVLVINGLQDLDKLYWEPIAPGIQWMVPVFDRLVEDGWDAVYLTEKGESETRFSRPTLYGWDCESILVMNPRCIIP